MAEQPSPAQQLMGDLAPKLVDLTDNLLFGDIWERPGLSKRDRSLITVSALTALYRTEQIEFYAGWPSAMSAITVLTRVVAGTSTE